jgi:hypothetical protein
MSESPAGARLNFAMRGDVRASPIEFSWGSQTVTSVTGGLPLRGPSCRLIQTSVFLDRELAVLYIRTTFRFFGWGCDRFNAAPLLISGRQAFGDRDEQDAQIRQLLRWIAIDAR